MMANTSSSTLSTSAAQESQLAKFQAQLETLLSQPSTSSAPWPSEDARHALEQLKAAFDGGSRAIDDDEVFRYIERETPDVFTPAYGTRQATADSGTEGPSTGSRSHGAANGSAAPTPDVDWLKRSLASIGGGRSDVVERVMALLCSHQRTDDAISSDLLDIIGFDAIDLLPEIIRRRKDIASQAEHSMHLSLENAHPTSNLHTNGTSTPIDSDAETQQLANGLDRRPKHRNHHNHNNRNEGIKFQLHSGMSIEELEQLHLQKLEEASNKPLFDPANAHIAAAQPAYPHVYANHGVTSATSLFGNRMMLPVGTTKLEHEHYSEVTFPTPTKHPSAYTATLRPVNQLPDLLQRSFPYETLNRLQSLVYPTAYETTENMLVCAPTGAGKTDVAVLTVLRALSMYADIRLPDGKMRNKEFKIVYVAPMKALASEIVRKMRKRFEWCGLVVRELTGDMQLTRKEIAETQMIVTTPEKWDVVTRKTTGEGELSSRLRLLIIDEVHLLHEDRGAVLETIVARTLRQVESSQTLIRIVGLSATLPNYVDVADFLRVNPYVGLFFFDSSFRPVPLEQHFIAAKGKPGGAASKENLDHATYEKTLELLKDGHPVLIFVHARKDTVKTALMLREKAMAENELEWFDASENPRLEFFKREIAMSRNREMKELVDAGIGIHHAGMLRSDRNISERLFEQNVTKVLVCTATLAWGVNLPAYAVIIKGTQLYDSSKGAFMDLSVLDVLQMFGRAGRPQYETHGVSYICTTSDKIDHYITAINQQVPIESKFTEGLVDALNAEISLGTVSTVDEGVRWLGYTFLHVRMRKNPMVYGLSHVDLANDPALGNRRRELIVNAAKLLAKHGMVRFDDTAETLISLDLGQTAARYYLRSASVETFNALFRPRMTEADLLSLLSKSSEFQQVAVRESETDELKRLIENVIPCQVNGGTDSSYGKANVLLQAYICKAQLEDFALISDMEYVAQNAARIARALVEMAISRRWSQVTASLLAICKAIEKRLWPWAHPLEQMSLQADLMYNINRWAEEMSIEDMLAETPASLGKVIHLNERLGGVAMNAAKQLPRLDIRFKLQPLSHDLLRVRLDIKPDFTWSDKLHGSIQYFWLWLSDADDQEILQNTKFVLRPETSQLTLDFTIFLAAAPSQLHVRAISDTFFGAEHTVGIDLAQLQMPPVAPRPREVIHMPMASPSSTNLHPDLAELLGNRSLDDLSAIEKQTLHSLFFTRSNVVIAAPSGPAGFKLAMYPLWRQIKRADRSISLVLFPRRASVGQFVAAYKSEMEPVARRYNASVHALQHTIVADRLLSDARDRHLVLVGSPKAAASFLLAASAPVTIDTVILNDVNALTAEYESLASRLLEGCGGLNSLPPRIIGLSASLLDASDVGRWLGADPTHVFAFSPPTRPQPIISTTVPFTQPHSLALFKSMAKPAYDLLRANISGRSICFVSHRGQTYNTAADLVTLSGADMTSFSTVDPELLEHYAQRLSDPNVAEALLQGISILNPSMHITDQAITRHLFNTGQSRVLVTTREEAYSGQIQADLVIVMGTQFAAGQAGTSERRILDYPIEDVLQMQTCAVALSIPTPTSISSAQGAGAGRFVVFTQKDSASLLFRFLNDGVPLESQLLDSELWQRQILKGIADGALRSAQHVLDAWSTTYLAQRVVSNPTYYGCQEEQEQKTNVAGSQQINLSRLVDRQIERFQRLCLVRFLPQKDGAPIRKDSSKLKATSSVMLSASSSALHTLEIAAIGRRALQEGVSLDELEELFALSDAQAIKLAAGVKFKTELLRMPSVTTAATASPHESGKEAAASESDVVDGGSSSIKKHDDDELSAFLGRLSKSIQRRAGYSKGSTSASEQDRWNRGALAVTLLSRKLGHPGSTIEEAQAELAIGIIGKLRGSSSSS